MGSFSGVSVINGQIMSLNGARNFRNSLGPGFDKMTRWTSKNVCSQNIHNSPGAELGQQFSQIPVHLGIGHEPVFSAQASTQSIEDAAAKNLFAAAMGPLAALLPDLEPVDALFYCCLVQKNMGLWLGVSCKLLAVRPESSFQMLAYGTRLVCLTEQAKERLSCHVHQIL